MARLIIDKNLLKENIKQIKNICSVTNCEILGVVKAVESIEDIISYIYEQGIKELGVSGTITDKIGKQTLLSLPSIKEVDYVVKKFKSSYNSSIETICRLSNAAAAIGVFHEIIIVIDTGDLREGIKPGHAFHLLGMLKELKLDSIRVTGIATNYACCNGFLPTIDSLNQFSSLALQLEKEFSLEFNTVSVGGSVVLDCIDSKHFPKKINQIRIGEAMFLGNIPGVNYKHPKLNSTTYFEGEIVEIDKKTPSLIEQRGFNAFGKKVEVPYSHERTRAILNFGAVHTAASFLHPVDDKIQLVSINSNYTIYDVTDSKKQYKLGDTIRFELDYLSFILAANSNFTKRIII
jgi:predicted amino acid racemase